MSFHAPKSMRALVVTSRSTPPTVETLTTPLPTTGSAVVKILAANVLAYTREIFDGTRKYPFPTPIVPGSSAIGRVTSLGEDATNLKPGDLVFVDCTLRSRDNPADVVLAGIHEGYSDGTRKLMQAFRNWTYADFTLAPLENLTLLDEKRLLSDPSDGGLGYSVADISYIPTLLVPYGGLRDIGLQAGETVIVAPATGPFGGAAVLVALAMGARVVAVGRNKASLADLKSKVPAPEHLITVPTTGNVEADTSELKKIGQIDAYFDIGPAEAYASTHIKSCILALRQGGRVSLMGGYQHDIAIPHAFIMFQNIRLSGSFMFKRSDTIDFVKLVERGMIRLGRDGGTPAVASFGLEQWREALDSAAEDAGQRRVVIEP